MKQSPKFVTKLFTAIDGYADIKTQNEQQALNLSQIARDVIKPVIEQHTLPKGMQNVFRHTDFNLGEMKC